MKKRYNIVAHVKDKRGLLLAVATNNYNKTHPIQAYFASKVGHTPKIYLHAEIAALLRCKDKQPHSIHVFRYGMDGSTALAKPCNICMEAIKAFGIKHIYYTTPGGIIHNDLTLD